MNNCVIADNSARWGAGAVVWGEFAMTNSLATGNVATSGGGGIYVGETSPVTITNSTIAGNEAGWGGGLQVADNCDVSLYNTILAQNTQNASTDDKADVHNNATLNAYNTLSSYSAWDAGANNLVYDASKPLFTDAANGDYTLAANSQAIDKGNNSYISGYSTDLAGNTRVVGGTVDLGAYERQSVARQDLIPYAPNGWSAPVVLATSAGATVDSATITSNDTVYVSFAVANAGEGVATGPFEMTLKLKDASGNVLKTHGPFADFDLEALSYVDALGNDADWNFGKLAPGTYTVTYTVDSGADVAESNESNNVYSKTFTVSVALPAAPTNVKFGAYDASTKKATLAWTDNATNETHYEIQSSTNGGASWTSLPNLAANATSRVCSGLQVGTTYVYRVRAVNAAGVSAWVSATIAPTEATVVFAPTNVKFGAYDASTKKATLTWTDNATNEVCCEIQSSTNGGAWKSLANLAANATNRVCGGLEIGNVYQYRLRAVAADGTASDWVSATIAPTVAPAAPTNVHFGAYDSANKRATLTWTDNATNEVRYEIQSSTNGGASWNSLSNLAANTTSRVCSGLQVGTTYVYRVRAVAADGTASDWVSATITPTVAVAAPTNVKFGAYDASAKKATLTWTDNATSEVRYEIQCSVNGGEWKSLSNLAANTTSRVCAGLEPGSTYQYRIRAVDSAGNASAWVWATIAPPAAPTNVKFGAYDATNKRATLTWTDNATNEVRYEIQSSTNGGEWKSLSNLAANTTSRVCSGLQAGTTYSYRIRAVNGDGVASNWVSATIVTTVKLTAPTSLTMVGYNSTTKRATLAWVDMEAKETGYEVQSSTNGGKSWNRLQDLGADSVSRSCAGLTAGQTFIYRIRAVSDTKVSDWASIMFYAPPAASSAVLASEVFATPFDESDFFADEDEFDVWARVRS